MYCLTVDGIAQVRIGGQARALGTDSTFTDVSVIGIPEPSALVVVAACVIGLRRASS